MSKNYPPKSPPIFRNAYAPKQKRNIQTNFSSWSPENFIGKLVKKEFKEEISGKVEPLWVRIKAVDQDGKNLLGEVSCTPLLELGINCGDPVEIPIFSILSCLKDD
jgi:hypothetical protein